MGAACSSESAVLAVVEKNHTEVLEMMAKHSRQDSELLLKLAPLLEKTQEELSRTKHVLQCVLAEYDRRNEAEVAEHKKKVAALKEADEEEFNRLKSLSEEEFQQEAVDLLRGQLAMLRSYLVPTAGAVGSTTTPETLPAPYGML